jgi:hypothetical protein
MTAGSFLLGLVASILPARWRRAVPALEASAYEAASIPSSLLQATLAIAVFVVAYLAWYRHQGELIDAAAIAKGGDTQEGQILGRTLMLANPVLPLIFLFTSWKGFVPAVVFVCGVIRTVHGAITREVMPDPVLGLVDLLVNALRTEGARRARENAKDTSPDRLYIGAASDSFVLCVDTAHDLDWNVGNTVVVAGEHYRLKAKREDRTPAGLRLRYELEVMPQGIAVRGWRRYDPKEPPIVMSAHAQEQGDAGAQ